MSGKPKIATEGRFDGLLWTLIITLLAVGVYGNYYFSEYSLFYRVLTFSGLTVTTGFIALQTCQGRAFLALLKEAKIEIHKMVWPTRQETFQTTLIVVAVVIIMGFILWVLDSLLGWMISSLIG